MSRIAEEAALKAYPERIGLYGNGNAFGRHFYIQGYEQAEKDLALTWEDVKAIFKIADNYDSELNRPKYLTQDYCKEILTRFNKQRKK